MDKINLRLSCEYDTISLPNTISLSNTKLEEMSFSKLHVTHLQHLDTNPDIQILVDKKTKNFAIDVCIQHLIENKDKMSKFNDTFSCYQFRVPKQELMGKGIGLMGGFYVRMDRNVYHLVLSMW
jgi:hypothetical protein